MPNLFGVLKDLFSLLKGSFRGPHILDHSVVSAVHRVFFISVNKRHLQPPPFASSGLSYTKELFTQSYQRKFPEDEELSNKAQLTTQYSSYVFCCQAKISIEQFSYFFATASLLTPPSILLFSLTSKISRTMPNPTCRS